MNKLSATLHQLGVQQRTRYVMPQLAMEVARAAARREIDPDDALSVYVDYYKAASTLKNVDPYDNGVKANVSKLRQIIKASDPALLDRVTDIHERLRARDKVVPLYHAMVAVCRIKNVSHRVSVKAIEKCCRR
jgi:hypothetical protein